MPKQQVRIQLPNFPFDGYCALHVVYSRQCVSYLHSCLYFKQSYLRATMCICFLNICFDMFPNFWSWHIKLNRIHSGFGKMKSASDVIFVTDVSLCFIA